MVSFTHMSTAISLTFSMSRGDFARSLSLPWILSLVFFIYLSPLACGTDQAEFLGIEIGGASTGQLNQTACLAPILAAEVVGDIFPPPNNQSLIRLRIKNPNKVDLREVVIYASKPLEFMIIPSLRLISFTDLPGFFPHFLYRVQPRNQTIPLFAGQTLDIFYPYNPLLLTGAFHNFNHECA